MHAQCCGTSVCTVILPSIFRLSRCGCIGTCAQPSRQLLRKLVARERTSARRCVLVEDTAVNLKSARQLGMRTVLVTQYLPGNPHVPAQSVRRLMSSHPSYVDVKLRSVRQLTKHLHRLQARK